MAGDYKQSAPAPYKRRRFFIINPREGDATVNTFAAIMIVSMTALIACIMLWLWPETHDHKNIVNNHVGDSACILFIDPIPSFKGGNDAMFRFISRNMKYPASAECRGIEGTVFVSFVVTATGKITDVSVVRGVDADCDKEAIRLVASMPDWDAAIQSNVPVPTRMVLPIKFKLPHD